MKQNSIMNNFYKIVKKNIIKISTVILFFVLSSNSACEDQNNRHLDLNRLNFIKTQNSFVTN